MVSVRSLNGPLIAQEYEAERRAVESGETEPWLATPGSADLPAIFRYEGRMLALILAAGLALIGAGVLCARVPAIIGSPVTASDQAAYWGLGLIVAAMGAVLIAGGLTSTLVLQEDAIEDRSIFQARRMMRAQIRGKASSLAGGLIKGYMIYSAVPGIEPMRIELVLKRTPAFDAWMRSVPEIEAPGLAKTRNSLLAFFVGCMVAGLVTGLIETWLRTLGTTSSIALRLIILAGAWWIASALIAWAKRHWRGPSSRA